MVMNVISRIIFLIGIDIGKDASFGSNKGKGLLGILGVKTKKKKFRTVMLMLVSDFFTEGW